VRKCRPVIGTLWPVNPVQSARITSGVLAFAQRFRRRVEQLAPVLLICTRRLRDFQGRFPNAPVRTTALMSFSQLFGRVELHLNIAEAVAVKHERPVAERACRIRRRFDVAPHLEKVVGIHALAGLSRIDSEHALTFPEIPLVKNPWDCRETNHRFHAR